MRGARNVAQYCTVYRSSSSKNAAGERVLSTPEAVLGLEEITVSVVPASQNTQATMNQRGVTVTHQIVLPNGAEVFADDLLEVAGLRYLVRSVAPLPKAVICYVEFTRGANA